MNIVYCSNVHHTRLGIRCISSVNYKQHANFTCQLVKMHYHYFVVCFLYDEQRLRMEDGITRVCVFEFKTLMLGREDLSFTENCGVFDAVRRYIESYQKA